MRDLLASYYGQRTIPTDGLVFHASLNGRDPAHAETGQTLTTSGSVTYGEFGGVPCAKEWSASGYIEFPATGLPSGSATRTMSYWCCGRAMIGYGRNASRALSYAYIAGATGGYNTSGNNVQFTELALPATRMTHVCYVLSGRNVSLYLDGELYATRTLSSNPATVLEAGRIGRYAGTSTDYYHGRIAACRIYSRALTAREVLLLSHEFQPTEVPQ